MPFNEADYTNQIAAQERAISGIKNSFDFSRNPGTLVATMLPAVLHYPPSFTSEPRGHHNLWKNTINVTSILCVLPRESQGAQLKFLENEAMPYGQKWRDRFQTASVITTLLANVGAVEAFLISGTYGAGGPLLTIGGTEYIGWIFSHRAINA